MHSHTTELLHITPQDTEIHQKYKKLHIDFDSYVGSLSFKEGDVRVKTVCPEETSLTLEHLGGIHGVVISGSRYSIFDNPPWKKELISFIETVIERNTPLLGICFGHQLIASIFGCEIIKGKKGVETGVINVSLTDKGVGDLLYKKLNPTFYALTNHEDIVLPTLPNGNIVLTAKSDTYEVQGLAIGDTVRTTQFHPDYDVHLYKTLTSINPPKIKPSRFGHIPDVDINESGSTILQNFITYFAYTKKVQQEA